MKSKLSRILASNKQLKFPVIIFLGFVLYLVIIPNIVYLRVPCLRFSPGESFTGNDCRVVMALDAFIILALTGFAVVIFIQHIGQNPRSLKHTLALASVLAISIIIAYHIYIPQAESAVKRAPIILSEFK